jgi:hypothetical protein
MKNMPKDDNKKTKTKSEKTRDFLFERDGNLCFYSHRPMTKSTATVEHLIPLSKGGKNCKENLVLCLFEYNQKVGNASLREKLEYRDKLLKEKYTFSHQIDSLRIQLNNSFTKIENLTKTIENDKSQKSILNKKIRELQGINNNY